MRRMGKGMRMRRCPPCTLRSWWARFALPTLRDGGSTAVVQLSDSLAHTSAFSRHHLPEVFHFVCPPEIQRAQGRPGARRTRGLMGDRGSECCPRAYRFGGNTPAFPAQWLYGLYDFVLVTGFLATIARSKREPLSELTPAPGRRTRTISPYASAAFVFAALASIASPPQRLRRWPTPLWWDRMAGVLLRNIRNGQRFIFNSRA